MLIWPIFGFYLMQRIQWIGLASLGGGLLIWLLYGLYNLLKELETIEVNPIVLIGGVAVAAGIIILLVSTAAERKSNDLEKINKEDLKP